MKNDEVQLSAEEETTFAALPRERRPGRYLEERTVRALESRGLLGGTLSSFNARRVPVWALALAASLTLFVSGVVTGQWLGTRTMANTIAAAQQGTAMQTASLVQRTGSAYVMALMALAQLGDSTSDPAVAQGREAALTSLRAAARELALLAPEDPLTLLLRDGLARTSLMDDHGTVEPKLLSVVWF